MMTRSRSARLNNRDCYAVAKPSSRSKILSPLSSIVNYKNILTVEHPYLSLLDKSSSSRHDIRRTYTLSSILLAERRVLRDLQRRSGWKVYPRGPSKCYTQVKERNDHDNSTDDDDVDDDDDDDDNIDVDTNSDTLNIRICNPQQQQEPIQMGRVNSLTLSDLTVYALLDVLDIYLHNNRNNDGRRRQNNPRPTVPPSSPPWTMPADIAVLDQLQTMEVFQCTGTLPESMNYLTRLRSLKLRSCHGLQMNTLSHNLTELEVTDSEGVIPSTFANFPHLHRLKLYCMGSSDASIRTMGRDWIRDLHRNNFAWNESLKDLCFCSSGLRNEDLATLMVDILPHKFTQLRSVFIISNAEITSFRPILQRWEERYQQPQEHHQVNCDKDLGNTSLRKMTSYAGSTLFIPPSLRVMSTTGTRISKTVEELQCIHMFLNLYHEIGLFMMVSLPSILDADVVRCVHQINHQLTINRAGGPVLFACNEERNSSGTDAFSKQENEQIPSSQQFSLPQRRRPLPLSMWPLVLERAMNLEYMACYESGDDASSQGIYRTNEFVDRGDVFMSRVDRVLARVQAIFQDRVNENNNDANAAANHPIILNPVVQNNEAVNFDNNNENVTMLKDWMEDATAFSGRSKYDALYHLLRYGPVLLATGNHIPFCRRRRSFIGRKCKRIKLF
jgi:hypothetical protein